MNEDTPRWLESGSDATDAERSMLRSDAADGPPKAKREAMWAALASHLSPGGGAPSSPTPTALTSKLATVSSVKVVLGVAAGAGLWWGGHAALHTLAVSRPAATTPAPSHVESAEPRANPNAPRGASETPRDAVETERADAATRSRELMREFPAATKGHSRKPMVPSAGMTPSAPSDAPRASASAPIGEENRLQAEGEALDRARSALRAGDPRRAEQLLDHASSEFSGGMLVQEREALAIETLWALGKRDDARARARRFLTEFPSSPYAARVRTFAK